MSDYGGGGKKERTGREEDFAVYLEAFFAKRYLEAYLIGIGCGYYNYIITLPEAIH